MFFKRFFSKNQLPGLSISGTLAENGLRLKLESRHLKVTVKCELSTLANKTETMPPNLWKTVNAQREHVNENVELLQQNISYLQKELKLKKWNDKIIAGNPVCFDRINK